MDDRVDLNSADQEAIDAIDELQGHGHEIVRYRNERGGFSDPSPAGRGSRPYRQSHGHRTR